ncbi:MAG: nuclear transport factor 2 family protein [Steroidobacteraceae bacterium]
MMHRHKSCSWLPVLLLLAVPFANAADAHRQDRTAATRAIASPFLLRLFGKHDVQGAYEQYAAPDFVQHDPEMADGLAGLTTFLQQQAKQPDGNPAHWADVVDIVLVDGAHFAVMHHVFRDAADAGRVVVDLWRVDGGRIVEHWRVMQPIPAHMANANGMACGKEQNFSDARKVGSRLNNPACGWPDPQAQATETQAVFDAYASELLSGDVRGAITRWLAADYRQHSPLMTDGIQGAIEFLEKQFGNGGGTVRGKFGPPRIIAEGDYLLVHRRVAQPDGIASTVNIDIFRVTSGHINEHWDLKQAIPDTAANSNGMW